MKISKKAIPVAAFALGACLFVSTAFADMMIGTGYDGLKSSLKQTAAQMEDGLDNYTIEAMFTLEANGRVLDQSSSVQKIDTIKNASENRSTSQNASGKSTSHYSYSDPKYSVWKSGEEEKYFVTEYPDNWEYGKEKRFTNPFTQEGAPEIERIVDALVGNLRDQVQGEERSDGGVAYVGTLTEAQVPAVVNAIVSFAVKQSISDQRQFTDEANRLPNLTSDVFVKRISGAAYENEQGLLESLTGEAVLSGKDENGAQHDITATVVFRLSDVGTTTVEVPDLQGANVEKVARSGFSSMYVGTYRNDIVLEENGEFVKIGERKLEISSVDGDTVAGKLTEYVKPEYAAKYGDVYDFDFVYEAGSFRMSTFTYTNAKGEQEHGMISPSGNAKLYLDLNIEVIDESSYRHNSHPYFNGEFYRVFEE